MRNYKRWSSEDLDDLCDNYYYYRGGHRGEAMRSFGCTWKAIETKAQRIGITKMKNGRQSNSACNLDYFRTINTSDNAYWIGFICADGHVHRDYKQVCLQVGLSSVDKMHLQKLARIFGKPVHDTSHFDKRTNKTYFSSCLIVHGNELCTDIVYFKEDVVALLDCISPLYKRDFIRGFFDGDGTVSIDYQDLIRFGFCSQDYDFLDRIMDTICDSTDLNKIKILKIKNHDCYEFRWHGKGIAVGFYNYLYNCSDLFLERKKDVFVQYLSRKGLI